MSGDTAASLSLQRWRDRDEYPFNKDWLDNPHWWEVMPPEVQAMDRDVAREYFEEILKEEQRGRDFIRTIAVLYPGAGFEKVSFSYVTLGVPDAVTFYVEEDGSYAIGLDVGMVALFTSAFASLLHAQLTGKHSVYWAEALHDITIMAFARKHHPKIDQRILARGREERYLERFVRVSTMVIERFLIAHELGHIYLQHFQKEEALRVAQAASADPREDVISRFAKTKEFEADDWAMDVLANVFATSPLYKILALYIPSIYLGFTSLKDQLYTPQPIAIYIGIFELKKQLFMPPGQSLSEQLRDTHPDVWERAERLHDRTVGNADQSGEPAVIVIATLYEVIKRERGRKPFVAAAARVRKRLKDLPADPNALRKNVSHSVLFRAYTLSLKLFVVYRRTFFYLNVVYYLAYFGIWNLYSDVGGRFVGALAVFWSMVGLGMAALCNNAAGRAAIWRAHIGAVGEALNILTGPHVSQIKFFARVSAICSLLASIALIFRITV